MLWHTISVLRSRKAEIHSDGFGAKRFRVMMILEILFPGTRIIVYIIARICVIISIHGCFCDSLLLLWSIMIISI